MSQDAKSLSGRPTVLAVSKLPPLYLGPLAERYEVLDRLHETDPAALAIAAPRIRAVAASGESKLPADLVGKLPALEIVAVMGVGYDGIDVPACKARGAKVTHTPDVLNDDVADLAMALLLAAIRRIAQGDRYVREGKWVAKGHMALTDTLRNRTLGMVGFGRIGKVIAKRAAAFDLKIVYHARTHQTGQAYVHYPRLVEMARDVDILMVIVPGGAATRHLINAQVLEALGPSGYLINVSRGSVVDEAALVKALEQGKIAGAGLDVFENEPGVPEALMKMDQVVLAPHVGSATHHTRNAMAQLVVDNLKAWREGRPPLTPVK